MPKKFSLKRAINERKGFYKKAVPPQLPQHQEAGHAGSQFQLNYNDSEKFQTHLGGIFSILITILVLAAAAVTIQKLISTKSPAVFVSYKVSNTVPKFDLYENNLFFTFSMAPSGVRNQISPKQVPRFATIKAYIEKFEKAYVQGDQSKVTNIAEINYIPCSELQDKRPIDSIVDNEVTRELLEASFLCPEMTGLEDKYFVESKFQNPPHYELAFYVLPCTLPDASECASEAELTQFTLYYSNIHKTLDVTNKANPLNNMPEFDGMLKMSFGQEKMKLSKLKYGEIRDDSWDFLDDSLNTRYVYYDTEILDTGERDRSVRTCDLEDVRAKMWGRCPPLLTMRFVGTGVTKVTTRSYPKFFTSLGEIGGTAEILMLIFMVLYLGYNNYYLKKYVKERMIGGGREERLAEILFAGEAGEREALLLRQPSALNELRGIGEQIGGVGSGEGTEKSSLSSKSVSGKFEGNARGRKGAKKGNSENLKKVNALLEKSIQENQDGLFLFRSLDTIRALEGIMLKPHHKALLPIALMNIAKRDQEEETKNQKKGPKGVGFRAGVIASNKVGAKGRPGKASEREIDLDKAYKKLVSYQPENKLQEAMDGFLFQNLPSYFKREARLGGIDEIDHKMEVIDLNTPNKLEGDGGNSVSRSINFAPFEDLGRGLSAGNGAKPKFVGMNYIRKKGKRVSSQSKNTKPSSSSSSSRPLRLNRQKFGGMIQGSDFQ